jgi:hypothetical protein
MAKQVNVVRGKKGFQKTVPKTSSPSMNAPLPTNTSTEVQSSKQLELEYSYNETFDKAQSLIQENVSLMNRGERGYDEFGRVCRPSDTFNEYRAISYMQSRYSNMAAYEYRPSEDMFASIDGAWYDSEGELLGYTEIKSHPGKTMGETTILNLRK